MVAIMGLYNFKSMFREKIEAGEKTHTIRAKRVTRAKAGETLHLYTGLRTKSAKLIGRVVCTRVQDILIEENFSIRIDGNRLAIDECEWLAKRDGFASLAEMKRFWDGRLPFEGDIIHWRWGSK
jgi:uncharacterized protein YqfB (UPF0267 family)